MKTYPKIVQSVLKRKNKINKKLDTNGTLSLALYNYRDIIDECLPKWIGRWRDFQDYPLPSVKQVAGDRFVNVSCD